MLTPAHIDLYVRIKSDPAKHAGFKLDEAVVFCIGVEEDLKKLSTRDQEILFMTACGYTQTDISKFLNISLRTAHRHIIKAKVLSFSKYREHTKACAAISH